MINIVCNSSVKYMVGQRASVRISQKTVSLSIYNVWEYEWDMYKIWRNKMSI